MFHSECQSSALTEDKRTFETTVKKLNSCERVVKQIV